MEIIGSIVPNMDMEEDQRQGLDAVMARLLGVPMDRQCKGTNKAGQPCGKPPLKDSPVCGDHGGRAPQVVEKARKRTEAREAVMQARRDVLDLTDQELIEQYGDPGQTLQWVIAVSRGLASKLQAALADQESLVYHDAFGNIHVRGEVGAMLKAADLAATHAERALRLGLDMRGLKMREQEIALLDRALDNALASAGIEGDVQRSFRHALRNELLAAEGEKTE